MMAMPRSVAAMRSSNERSSAPGSSETFGMRWNCTLDQLSAYEQPWDRVGRFCCSYHQSSQIACSRVVW